ncbi:hypothetical protein N6P31_01395 [Pectobacterium betavasculorum]|uniref:hypothetical protein n=1 Tax=Pectobacterium betavasculorum TaxID=55207 RepID=UPI00313BA03F
MEKNIKHCINHIKNKLIESRRTDITQTLTDEQRRIAALEDRITSLETALAGTQVQVTLNAEKFGFVG